MEVLKMSEDRSPETWHDPIVAEVRQAREALFAEANYDIREFCRRLSARQAASGHPVVKRGSASVEDSEAAYPSPRVKAG
ncbi:MAG: hypothetical protein ACJ76N_04860 [Thermoanaerobaculia bacterium]